MLGCVARWENLAIISRLGTGKLGFRYSRNEGQDLSVGEVSQPGLRDALLDTDPATAFDPFLNFTAHNTKAARSRVYVTLHNSGEYELPIGYATINGDLFNLPAGPVSFALGGEYDAPRWTRDRDALNTTFQSIGSIGWRKRTGEPGCLVNLPGSAGTLHQPDVELPRLL